MILSFTRKKSKIHGWGLFADKFIPNNTIIEKCTYILTTEMMPTFISPYTFPNSKEKGTILPLGYATLLNSSNPPNCKHIIDDEFLTILTIKEVKVGEELTLKYR